MLKIKHFTMSIFKFKHVSDLENSHFPDFQDFGQTLSEVNNKVEKVFRPLKGSDLKGSSVWKGSAGGSLALLLLNMAIFDLKDSS